MVQLYKKIVLVAFSIFLLGVGIALGAETKAKRIRLSDLGSYYAATNVESWSQELCDGTGTYSLESSGTFTTGGFTTDGTVSALLYTAAGNIQLKAGGAGWIVVDDALVSATDGSHDLGHASYSFKDLYLDGTAYTGTLLEGGIGIFNEIEVLELIAGANFDYFFSDTASGVGAYFTMATTPTGDAESTFSDTITNDAFLIESFITPSGEPTFDTISAGIYELHFHADSTVGAQTQTVTIYYEFYKRLTGSPFTETLIATSEETEILTDVKTSYNLHCIHSEEDVTDSQLLIKVYANLENESPPNDPVVTIYAEGVNATRFSATTNIDVFDARYVNVSLADAASDFLVASGNDVFAKKTLAETGALLEGDMIHDNLQSIPANDHIDWTASTPGTIHIDAYVENVTTNLSAGTRAPTTIDVNSSDGTNATLVEADTTNAGILGSDKWDEIVANTVHLSSDGSDHSFINQDVTSTGTPTFNNTTIGNAGAGVDYTLTFDGEDDDCVITYDEDNNKLGFGDTDITTTGDIELNEGQKLIFNADDGGDTYIVANADDSLSIYVQGVEVINYTP